MVDGDDDVLPGRVAVALARLGADLLAERAQALLRAAIGDDALDPRQRFADAGDLALGLPAAADDAERPGLRLGQILGRNAAGGAGAQLAHPVGLDHARHLGLLGVEENDDERRPAGEPCVRLHAGEPELAVGSGHDGERAVGQSHAGPRPILDLAARKPLEAGLDRRQRIGRREELFDLGFGEVERQAAKPISASSRPARRDVPAMIRA